MKLKRTIALALIIAALSPSVYAADSVYLKENSSNAVINGKTEDIEYDILNIDGTAYIPLRAISKVLGYDVYWKEGKIVVGTRDEKALSEMVNDDYLAQKFDEAKAGTDLSDIRKIKEKLKEAVYDKEADPSKALSLWKEDGSFEGIEYFNPDRMVWNAKDHVDYVRTMLKAVYTEGNQYYGDKEIKEKIKKSLEFWATGGRVECDNWWQQEIGIPGVVSDILILNPEELTDEVRAVLNAEAAKGSIFNEKITDRITERPVSNTGANLTDKLLTSFKIDIATENEAELYDGLHLLENELRVFEKIRTDEFGEDSDGIKADYSFHQHVDQIQSGSYGDVMVGGAAKIISYIKGTKYKLSDYALNEFTNFLLDGQQWMTYKGYMELTTAGRHITRPDAIKGMKNNILKAVEALEGNTQIERYGELMEMKKNRLGEGDVFEGNRHFWLSDYMSHNRNGYHLGIKLASSRTKCGEVVNNENLLGYYLSDGVTTLMQDGDEYYNLMPLWDWNRLPGTTTPQGGLKNLNDWAEWNGEHLWNWKGNRNFVGGVSDGMYGAAVMDYSRDGLDAHKSWFMFDDRMVALGNNINSYTNMDIYTNINQCVLDGDVTVSKNGKKTNIKVGDSKQKADYILHNGIGYITNAETEVSVEERENKYEVINLGAAYKDQSEKKTVFEIGINHGKKPENASYEYTTVFNADETKMDGIVKKNTVKVLRNDDKVQAVYDSENKITQAIVWKMDKIEIPGGLTVDANKKCALIIKELPNGEIEITASNPTNEPKDLQLVVNKKLKEDGVNVVKENDSSTRIKFRLNEGIYGGSSTTYNSAKGFTEFLN